ncbi:hypothetical protein GLOTRDRAFT_139522 [Gloeophyllum trabeum ATCC 11539]|uniref:DUF6532 domain-containing protein n=1 Tax=Gloeophyllum trabeum (strain ATCC 11539 / FP-39264 / Madison 617) TaxID=670483 RepID=S7Q3W3_GLOTA|nr:uncharacterized protein GLOTRDRAFT_139522 [Gloeophyllum trabeum ATCC 11539]EPQ54138.1 hypothetical protein GLOTRDRAFT_139522 [Gloeophyllum trabeum ATCC 11539]
MSKPGRKPAHGGTATRQRGLHLTTTGVSTKTAPELSVPAPAQEPTPGLSKLRETLRRRPCKTKFWLQGRKRAGSGATEPVSNSKKSKSAGSNGHGRSAQESEKQRRTQFRAAVINEAESASDDDRSSTRTPLAGDHRAPRDAPKLTTGKSKRPSTAVQVGSSDEAESASGNETASNVDEIDENEEDDEWLDGLEPRRLEEELSKEATSWAQVDLENFNVPAQDPSETAAHSFPGADELFDDDDDILPITPPRRSKASKPAAKGKRQLAHDAEVPHFATGLPVTPARKSSGRSGGHGGPAVTFAVSPSSLRFAGDNEDEDHHEESSDEDEAGILTPGVALQGPTPTDLIFNERGRVNLSDQSDDVKAVTREAIKGVAKYLAFTDAFPEIGGRIVLSRDCLVTAARGNPRYQPILLRLVNEEGYARSLSRIPDGRISTSRRNAYNVGCNHVVGSYGLTPGSACEKLVVGLLKSQKYIFPGDGLDRLRKTEPYKNPAILAILSALYFSGSGALGMKHPDLFTSTSLTDPAPEIPISMVALVATTIHNALMEWQSGKRQAREFSALNCGDVYRTHVEILEKIKVKAPGFFHQMMVDIYRRARAAAVAEVRVDSEDSAFTFMDLSGYS